MAKDPTPKNADFIGKVVSDAANPPETRLLSGWLGDAGDKALRRLYTDPDLSSYIDIPADAILHTEEIKDVQPAGSVLVWVKRDAALKQGGSASSRAARFLQGQVQQDFASGGAGSFEKAGLRCVTQPPCTEPTGFSGICTKQPDVGGCWPCITAIPHCVEPTGFTGKCTHQPWPNPTQYAGCTIFHCPTQDLTHNPHICNLIATGMPGCVPFEPGPVIDPGQAKGKVGAPAPTPPVSINCGHTQMWGLCGGGTTQDVNCVQTAAPGCAFSRNPICTDLPGCGTQVSIQIPCADPKTETKGCVTVAQQVAFGAARQAGPGVPAFTVVVQNCFNPSAIDACPSRIQQFCPTPNTQCTQNGPECQTHQAPQCPTHQPCCTQSGPHCRTIPQNIDCTFGCTQFGPNCPTFNVNCPVQTVTIVNVGAAQQQAIAPTFVNCEPTPATVCFICPPSRFGECGTQPPYCVDQLQAGGVGAAQQQAIGIAPTPATRCFICPPSQFVSCQTQAPLCIAPTPATRCFICPPVDAQAVGAANRAIGTQFFNCPTPATRCFFCPPQF